MRDYTDITVLVDRSGSMMATREAMEEAYAGFLKGHQANPSTRVTLVQFDGQDPYSVVYTALPVGEAEPLRIYPRGSTPLVDATCKAIDATGRRLRNMPEAKRPARVLMVVITDGEENASTDYTAMDLRRRLTRQQEQYSWQFIYMGADIKAVETAVSYGFQRARSAYFTGTATGFNNLGSTLTSNTVNYASTGDVTKLAFTTEQQTALATGGDTTTLSPNAS